MYILENYSDLINYIKRNAYSHHNHTYQLDTEILLQEMKETRDLFISLGKAKKITREMAQDASVKYAQLCSRFNDLPFEDRKIRDYRECLNQELLAITYIDTDCEVSLEDHLKRSEDLRNIRINHEQLNLHYLAEFEEDGVSKRNRIKDLQTDNLFLDMYGNHLKDAGKSCSSPELEDLQKACRDIQQFVDALTEKHEDGYLADADLIAYKQLLEVLNRKAGVLFSKMTNHNKPGCMDHLDPGEHTAAVAASRIKQFAEIRVHKMELNDIRKKRIEAAKQNEELPVNRVKSLLCRNLASDLKKCYREARSATSRLSNSETWNKFRTSLHTSAVLACAARKTMLKDPAHGRTAGFAIKDLPKKTRLFVLECMQQRKAGLQIIPENQILTADVLSRLELLSLAKTNSLAKQYETSKLGVNYRQGKKINGRDLNKDDTAKLTIAEKMMSRNEGKISSPNVKEQNRFHEADFQLAL